MTLDVEALGLRFHATIGFYDDGRPGEIFLTNHKAGSMAGILASDSAVLRSIALQHGVPIETLRHALMRDPQGCRPYLTCSTAPLWKNKDPGSEQRCQRWLHNFGRCDEWNLCLIARTVVRANQERR
jgi:hypothetical protein